MIEVSDIMSLEPVEHRGNHLVRAFLHAHREGAILEFGVYKGRSLRLLSEITAQSVHGFDSFKGLPQDWVRRKGDARHRKGAFGLASPPKMKGDNIVLHKGWFVDTIPKWLEKNKQKVKFLHIDCDLYSSTKQVLTLLNHRIVSGTIIVFDELIKMEKSSYTFWEKHEWKAMQEWLEEYGRKVRPILRTNHEEVTMEVL